MTIDCFLGCAESAVLIPNKPMKLRNIIHALTLANEIALHQKEVGIHFFKNQDC